jgi:hypothetical protein
MSDCICVINISHRSLLLPLSFSPFLWAGDSSIAEPQIFLLSVVVLLDHSRVTVSLLAV